MMPTDPKQMRFQIAKTRTNAELNELMWSNEDYFSAHPYLYLIVKDQRKIINNIRRMKIACTPVSEMN